MRFLLKFLVRVALNAAALYIAGYFLDGFILPGTIEYLILGGFVLAIINIFVKPVLRFISFPLIIITFGLFSVVINIIILLIADTILAELVIQNYITLFLASIIIGIANSVL